MTDKEYWSLDPAAHQFIHKMQAQRAKEETAQVPLATANMQRLLSMWWLLAWRGTLGGFVLGAIAGSVSQILFGTGAAAAGLVAGLLWNLVVIQMLLEKKFRGFHLAVIEE
jgi:hypothetical protein